MKAGQVYPLGTISVVPMAYEEKEAYEVINVVYKSKRGTFLVFIFLRKNDPQFEKCLWPKLPLIRSSMKKHYNNRTVYIIKRLYNNNTIYII